ncbi:N-alpha-acetyltransferase 25, NatB auxiliary subunit [Engraulis encrasicolus]|uniref:N-alpha-acetyltransferase 25, NatB auxiliary subunit n=1 Tax=Engraulis encrasicolus TaxID=184585 RepID=UPI002FD58EC4
MAARGHVQDPNDRRLRPIYDYLDNGQNKLAIQQADKLLKKHKDLHCAKVLKAIGLQRTGRQEEAFSLAQEVTVLEPTDDNSLQALTILYREMHRPELVTKLYEAAVRKVPSSEEYHSHLFMAYARVGDYKKMQQAGMALYKIVPKNPYYFWSVMSLLMQAISAQDEKLAQTMFLPLAERMVEKMVKEDKIEAEAEVQLYFMILERLGKCVEALEVLRGPLGEKLTSELQCRETKCMVLYKRLESWPECNALSLKLLLKNPDDWQFYLSYFESLFHLIDQSWTPPSEGEHCAEGEVHTAVSQAVCFVEERVRAEEEKETRPLRGPYLSRLELIRHLRKRGLSEEATQLGDPLELMVQYFGKFGDKPCCITDLKIFLDLLPPDQHVQFTNRLMEGVPLNSEEVGGDTPAGLPSDTRALQRHLCVTQLTRSLGLHHALEPAGKLQLITQLKAHYQHGLQFGKSCLKTELQFSDMYCLMAAHVYVDLWMESGDETMLWRSICVLEEGLTHSPSNAQFKLLLLLLFCRLGAFEPVVDLYTSLDAKHVQHDTIGYLLTRYAEALGQFAAASQSCNFSLRFFHSNQKDTSEYIIQAYKYGAFEKIPEFIAFRTRLNHSLHFAQVRTERMLLDLFLEADLSSSLEESVKAMSLTPEEDDIPWDCLRDNRDLTVMVSWDPPDRHLTDAHRKQSVEEETTWLRVRSLTLRLIGSLALLSPTPPPQNSEKTNENGVASKHAPFHKLLPQLETALQEAENFTQTHTKSYPVLGPPATRMGVALQTGACSCQLSALRLVASLLDMDNAGLDESAEAQAEVASSFKALLQQIQGVLSKCKGELVEMREGTCNTHASLLEALVLFIETVCVVLWVVTFCASLLRPLKSQKKKKKKKETSTSAPLVVCSFQELVAGLQAVMSEGLDHIKEQETNITALNMESLSLHNQQEEGVSLKTVFGKVQSSYLRSLSELSELLKKRMEVLKGLKI